MYYKSTEEIIQLVAQIHKKPTEVKLKRNNTNGVKEVVNT